MASDADTLPLDEWLKRSDAELAERQRQLAEVESDAERVAPTECQDALSVAAPTADVAAMRCVDTRTPTVDEVHNLARALTHLNRLKLTARLWTSLPPTYRSVLIKLQLEDIQSPSATLPPDPPGEMAGQTLRRFLFDPSNTSELYSAPRRFDLATIFVVTAAYSLLLGGLTALDFGPTVKIVAVGLLTVVAAAQAIFHQQANPRGVSVLAGAAAYTFVFLILWLMYPRGNPFFVTVMINGIVFGSLLGYMAGVLVGGMFLVAERLRKNLAPRQIDGDEPPEPSPKHG
jgi:hypothetical protein